MARSKSKNKTLAVGDTAHAGITALQERLGLKNHDETIRHLLDHYCSNPAAVSISLVAAPTSYANPPNLSLASHLRPCPTHAPQRVRDAGELGTE